jgi:hypothetical protein
MICAMNTRRPRFRKWLVSPLLSLVLISGLGGLSSCMKAPNPATMSGAGSGATEGEVTHSDPVLTVTAPADWTETEPQHSFYLKTWELPGGGIANISYFGNNTKIVQDNLQRWINQFQSADGSPIEKVKRFSLDDAPIETSMISLEGTMVATAQVGGGDARVGWMLIGGVMMAPHGPLYVKVLGPRDSLHPQMDAVNEMLRGLKAE